MLSQDNATITKQSSKYLSMLENTNTHFNAVPLHMVIMSSPLELIFASKDLADHSQQNKLKMCLYYSTLNMRWSVLIPPNVLVGIGPLLVDTTALEFISAQSPHSMKGLLVGVFFAIKGLLQFLGSIVIIPLSLKQTWGASIISCGFIYFLFICVVGLFGFILFLVAAKKYKYRKRDDVTFCQRC